MRRPESSLSFTGHDPQDVSVASFSATIQCIVVCSLRSTTLSQVKGGPPSEMSLLPTSPNPLPLFLVVGFTPELVHDFRL